MKKQKVIYVKSGLANFYPDRIEINESLKSNKKLRDYIVKHELGHKESFDLMHEFKSIDLKIMPSLFKFIITHPSTYIDFLPIQYKDKQLVYDLNLLILYTISLLLLGTTFLVFYYLVTI
jgi:hypothetical protein